MVLINCFCHSQHDLYDHKSPMYGGRNHKHTSKNSILEITCEELSNPENGTVSLPTERIVDSIATYTCNDSFELVGDASVTCQLNGTWSAEEPTCIGMSALLVSFRLT